MDISFKFKPRLKPRVTFVKGPLALYGSLACPIEQAAYAAGGEGSMEVSVVRVVKVGNICNCFTTLEALTSLRKS